MPFCPHCHAEYRQGIARCAHCEVELTDALPESELNRAELLREAAGKGEAAPIARASYAEACQMTELLHSHGVDALVVGDPEGCGKGGQCSYFFVAVLPDDIDAARDALQGEFRRLVDVDEDCRGADPDAVVDLDAEGGKACPACGASFEGAPEECPDCGLYLGVG